MTISSPINSTGRAVVSRHYLEAVLDESIQALEGCEHLDTFVRHAPCVDETGCNWIAEYEQPKTASPSACLFIIEIIGSAKRQFNLA